MGCHFPLQGIFPTQRSNPGLLHYRQIPYRLSHQGSLLHLRDRAPSLPPMGGFHWAGGREGGREQAWCQVSPCFPSPLSHHWVALKLSGQVTYTEGPGSWSLMNAFTWIHCAHEQRRPSLKKESDVLWGLSESLRVPKCGAGGLSSWLYARIVTRDCGCERISKKNLIG